MTRRGWMVVGTGAVVVGAAVLGLALSDPGLDVEMATVARGPLRVTVDEDGRTRLRDRFVVAAPVAGRLARSTLVEGQRVSAGEVLATLAPLPEGTRETGVSRGRLAAAQARRAEAAAQLDAARAVEAQARRDLDRAGALLEAGAVSRGAFEQAELAATAAARQVETRRAAVRAADADVAAARAALTGVNPEGESGVLVEVRAPADGRVLRVLEQSARVVPAGTPLLELGDAAGLEVVVDVLSEDAVRIVPGSAVIVERWGGDNVLHGVVRLVEPEAFTKVSALGVEEQRVNVVIDLVETPAALGAGYRLEARIVTWAGEDVLQVPSSALFQQADGTWAVFVVSDARASRRPVVIGHRATEAVEVLEGLSEGDRIVLYPPAEVVDGVKVH